MVVVLVVVVVVYTVVVVVGVGGKVVVGGGVDGDGELRLDLDAVVLQLFETFAAGDLQRAPDSEVILGARIVIIVADGQTASGCANNAEVADP